MTSTTQPTFLLGVGAQKAGTTWLFRYVGHYPQADMGELKEYHVWDGLTVPAFAEFDVRDRRRSVRAVLGDIYRRTKGRRPDETPFRRRLQRDPGRYFDYFSGLLARDGVTLTGDITPSYSALSTETLARIRDGFAARRIPVKALFLMRDPVERCFSAVRMYHRNGLAKHGVDLAAVPEDNLLSHAASPQAQLRTDYPATIAALEAVFDPADLYFGFYETMFTETELTRLSAFLGVAPDPAFLGRSFNVTQKRGSLPEALRRDVAKAFAPVYDYCHERFPETRQLWSQTG